MIKNILKYLLKFIYFNLKILYVILIIPIIVIICVSFSKDSSKVSKSYILNMKKKMHKMQKDNI